MLNRLGHTETSSRMSRYALQFRRACGMRAQTTKTLKRLEMHCQQSRTRTEKNSVNPAVGAHKNAADAIKPRDLFQMSSMDTSSFAKSPPTWFGWPPCRQRPRRLHSQCSEAAPTEKQPACPTSGLHLSVSFASSWHGLKASTSKHTRYHGTFPSCFVTYSSRVKSFQICAVDVSFWTSAFCHWQHQA